MSAFIHFNCTSSFQVSSRERGASERVEVEPVIMIGGGCCFERLCRKWTDHYLCSSLICHPICNPPPLLIDADSLSVDEGRVCLL